MNGICACGCGKPIVDGNSQTLYASKTCRRRQKNRRAIQMRSQPGRLSMCERRKPCEPLRAPKKICGVCYDLPERRVGVCPGCGRGYALEQWRKQA